MQSVWLSRNDYERRVRAVSLFYHPVESYQLPFLSASILGSRNPSPVGRNQVCWYVR